MNWLFIRLFTLVSSTNSKSFNLGSLLSRLVVNLRLMSIHRDFPTCGVVASIINEYTCWFLGLVSFVQAPVMGLS